MNTNVTINNDGTKTVTVSIARPAMTPEERAAKLAALAATKPETVKGSSEKTITLPEMTKQLTGEYVTQVMENNLDPDSTPAPAPLCVLSSHVNRSGVLAGVRAALAFAELYEATGEQVSFSRWLRLVMRKAIESWDEPKFSENAAAVIKAQEAAQNAATNTDTQEPAAPAELFDQEPADAPTTTAKDKGGKHGKHNA